MVKYQLRMKPVKFGRDPKPNIGFPVTDYQVTRNLIQFIFCEFVSLLASNFATKFYEHLLVTTLSFNRGISMFERKNIRNA